MACTRGTANRLVRRLGTSGLEGARACLGMPAFRRALADCLRSCCGRHLEVLLIGRNLQSLPSASFLQWRLMELALNAWTWLKSAGARGRRVSADALRGVGCCRPARARRRQM